YGPGPHRMQLVGEHQGVRYIDDSKATNAHAAAAALSAMQPGSTVWIAGGLAKGARFDELVAGSVPMTTAARSLSANPATSSSNRAPLASPPAIPSCWLLRAPRWINSPPMPHV